MAVEKKESYPSLVDGAGDGVALRQVKRNDLVDDSTSASAALIARRADESGDYINLRKQDTVAPTDDAGEYVLGMSAKKKSDDKLQLLNVDDDGNLLVSSEGAKTPYSKWGEITAPSLDTATLVVEVDLGAVGEKIDELELIPSSFKDQVYEIYHVDDKGVTDVETLLLKLRVPGEDGTKAIPITCLNLDTTGGTDAQAIRIKALQQRGTLSLVGCFACAKAN